MTETGTCKKCGKDFEYPIGWGAIGSPVQCPHCGAEHELEWEENDESAWFWLGDLVP